MAQITPESQRQGARLRALREARGWKKSMVSGRLGYEASQSIDLYERGISVIRLDQVRAWAAAFEMSEREFTSQVLGIAPLEITAPWSLEDYLREHGVAESRIAQAIEAAGDESPEIQQVYAKMVVKIDRKARSSETSPRVSGDTAHHADETQTEHRQPA